MVVSGVVLDKNSFLEYHLLCSTDWNDMRVNDRIFLFWWTITKVWDRMVHPYRKSSKVCPDREHVCFDCICGQLYLHIRSNSVYDTCVFVKLNEYLSLNVPLSLFVFYIWNIIINIFRDCEVSLGLFVRDAECCCQRYVWHSQMKTCRTRLQPLPWLN